MIHILPRPVASSHDILQQAMHMKGLLSRYFSHEMRNPLNTASMGLDYVIKELKEVPGVTDSLSEAVEDVKRACSNTLELLSEMLIYDKLENGMMELEKENVPAYRFIESCMKPFQMQVSTARRASPHLTLFRA